MSAITANKRRLIKNPGSLMAFPVASGETMYQGAIVGVNASGYLVNVAAGNVDALKLIGVVADDSANVVPAATTANGNLASDVASEVAGDKTVRLIYVDGEFLMDFSVSVAQANVGDKAYAGNNNDCQLSTTAGVAIGTIVSFYSSAKAWVKLNWMPKLAE